MRDDMEELLMALDYTALGQRISFFRTRKHITQEELADNLNLNRAYLAQIETAVRHPSIETGVSVDDLLVDSLTHSVSTADTEVHRLLIDCNENEAEILTRNMKELKAILYSLGI